MIGVESQSEFVLHLVSRELVIQEAETWLGTPYHHMARVKGAGVDCGQLPLGVYYNTGCIPYIKTEYYPPDFYMHRDEEWYRGIVEVWAEILHDETELRPADLVLYKIGRLFAHGAIVVEWPRIIHAKRGRGVVYDDGTQGELRARSMAFFRPKAFLVEG